MPDRLSSLDAAFLYQERPNLPMNIAGLAVLDPSTAPGGRLTHADLLALVGRRIHLMPRLMQRAVRIPFEAGRPVWADDPGFDLSRHVLRAALPAPGRREQLAAFAAETLVRPLDRDRPLWEMVLVEGLEGGRVALLVKWHHAVIDGMSSIDISSVLFDPTREPRDIEPPPPQPAPEPSPLALLADAIAEQVIGPLRAAWEAGALALADPSIVLDEAALVRRGLESMRDAGPPPPSPFNAPVGPGRILVTAEMEVAEARAIKAALGGTVNDVVLTAVAGAVGRLLQARGLHTEGVALRTLIPVSTRQGSQRLTLGNLASFFFVDLPVGPMEEVTRLGLVAEATARGKASHQAEAAAALIRAGDWVPPPVHAAALRLAAQQDHANLLVTNIRGYPGELFLAGARHLVSYPLIPLGERLALTVAAVSLGGVLGFGFMADPDVVPDAPGLAAGLQASLGELSAEAARTPASAGT